MWTGAGLLVKAKSVAYQTIGFFARFCASAVCPNFYRHNGRRR
ncbi:MAG TPA: hypothetical protein VGB02_19810 [Pyrinomonadaceae bacterium]